MFRSLTLTAVLIVLFGNASWAQRSGGGSRSAGGARPSGNGLDPLSSSVPSSALTPRTSVHAEDEGRVVFKSQTILVQVPAVVTDKTGNHVHGLTRDDFKIYESGKEQKITAFEEFAASGVRLQAPAQANTFSNLTQNGQPPRSVTVIALDGVNTPFLDQAYGRKQLIKFLADNVDPGQVLALVSIGSGGMKVLCGLTTDPAILMAALKKVSGEIPAMQGISADDQALAAIAPNYNGVDSSLRIAAINDFENLDTQLLNFVSTDDTAIAAFEQERAVDSTVRSFLDIAQFLSGIPGRKSLIWLTGGFPFYMESASAVPGGNLTMLYERAMAAMNDAQIAVYPVDARGLVNYLPVADGTLAPSSAARSTITHGAGINSVAVARGWLQASTISTLQDFANMTGGRAFYNRNDLTTGFKLAADDSSAYYLLGFYLDTHNDKPGWRKLQVKLQHKDAEVRSRNGFFVTNATMDPSLSRQLDINSALSSPFDGTGLAITARWQGSVADGTKRKVGFALNVPSAGVINEADQNRFDLDFIAQATAKDGTPAGSVGQTAKGALPPDKLAEIKAQGISYRNSLDLPPGSYQVKFVVRDNQRGRVGSVTAPLTVN